MLGWREKPHPRSREGTSKMPLPTPVALYDCREQAPQRRVPACFCTSRGKDTCTCLSSLLTAQSSSYKFINPWSMQPVNHPPANPALPGGAWGCGGTVLLVLPQTARLWGNAGMFLGTWLFFSSISLPRLSPATESGWSLAVLPLISSCSTKNNNFHSAKPMAKTAFSLFPPLK